MLRISKLDPDLHGAYVLPLKHLILETSKAQNSLEKTQRSVILQEIIPLVISLKYWSNSNSEKSFARAIAFQMKSCIEYVSL